jgi:hypothetical protein
VQCGAVWCAAVWYSVVLLSGVQYNAELIGGSSKVQVTMAGVESGLELFIQTLRSAHFVKTL